MSESHGNVREQSEELNASDIVTIYNTVLNHGQVIPSRSESQPPRHVLRFDLTDGSCELSVRHDQLNIQITKGDSVIGWYNFESSGEATDPSTIAKREQEPLSQNLLTKIVQEVTTMDYEEFKRKNTLPRVMHHE